MINKKFGLKEIVLGTALAAGAVGLTSYISCREQKPAISQKQEYSMKDITKSLGYRWNSLNENQKQDFKKVWDNNDPDVQNLKKYFCSVYENPEKFYETMDNKDKKSHNHKTKKEEEDCPFC